MSTAPATTEPTATEALAATSTPVIDTAMPAANDALANPALQASVKAIEARAAAELGAKIQELNAAGAHIDTTGLAVNVTLTNGKAAPATEHACSGGPNCAHCQSKAAAPEAAKPEAAPAPATPEAAAPAVDQPAVAPAVPASLETPAAVPPALVATPAANDGKMHVPSIGNGVTL